LELCNFEISEMNPWMEMNEVEFVNFLNPKREGYLDHLSKVEE